MTSPVEKTIRFLLKSGSPSVLPVLIAALDRSLPTSLLEEVVTAIIKLNNKKGHRELIHRFQTFKKPVKQRISEERVLLSHALQQGISSQDEERIIDCLELIRFAEIDSQLPILIKLISEKKPLAEAEMLETFLDLVSSLNEKQQKKDPAISSRIKKVQQFLSEVCLQFEKLSNKDAILKAVLILGTPNHLTIQTLLAQKNSECCQMALRLLKESKHPGIMQLLVDSFSTNYPSSQLIKLLQARKDINFIIQLLRWLPKDPNRIQRGNFSRIQSLEWLTLSTEQLEMVPHELQEPLARLISFLGLPTETKRSLQEWIIRNGTPSARNVATDVLSKLEPEKAQQILQNALNSKDEEVQAWSVGQLRSQNIPDAMKTLIGCLEDDSEKVRDAARNELQGFNLDFVISNINKLSPTVCQKVGRLLKKIDPDIAQKLDAELRHPIYHRRLQAIRAIQLLGIAPLVMQRLYEFLEDDDVPIRRLSAEILATDPTEETLDALKKLTSDPSPRVREIVQHFFNNPLLKTSIS